MAKLNIAKVNTLIRKGYFLAGVIMAANMFIGNEMRAMNLNKNHFTEEKKNIKKELKELNELKEKNKEIKQVIEELGKDVNKLNKKNAKIKKQKKTGGQGFRNFLLSHENLINLIGGAVFSVFNNYFKWWDYNPGTYCKFVWLGLRSKRFLKDILQFEVNFNAVRGIFWSLKKKKEGSLVSFFIKDILLRGCISMPLTLHLPKINFSMSISLDSILWIGVDKILELKAKKAQLKLKRGEGNDID